MLSAQPVDTVWFMTYVELWVVIAGLMDVSETELTGCCWSWGMTVASCFCMVRFPLLHNYTTWSLLCLMSRWPWWVLANPRQGNSSFLSSFFLVHRRLHCVFVAGSVPAAAVQLQRGWGITTTRVASHATDRWLCILNVSHFSSSLQTGIR